MSIRGRRPELPPTPLGWKLWFAFCAVVGVAVLGVLVWLVIAAISWLQRH
jgi:hypothetical protein